MLQRRTACLAVSALIFGAICLPAEGPPPKVQLKGDHWSAWDAPESAPEGAEIHTVVQGDTLWDLAERYFGDAYLWPQIWERNSYVLDAHWIYPGDPLILGVTVTPISELEAGQVEESTETAEPEEPETMFGSSFGDPVPLGGESDIYCSGFIADPKTEFGFMLTGAEFDHLTPTLSGGPSTTKLGLTMGDIVYVDGGREKGLIPGTLFSVVRPEAVVKHPLTGRTVGRYFAYLGRVRILSVQDDTGIAEIAQACHPISAGAVLMPFVPEPIPLARRSGLRGVNDPISRDDLMEAATIVLSDEGRVSIGQGHVVYIDRGKADEVTPGDIFTIYRETSAGQPLMVVGELAVLSAHEETSLTMVIESRFTILVGDRADPKYN